MYKATLGCNKTPALCGLVLELMGNFRPCSAVKKAAIREEDATLLGKQPIDPNERPMEKWEVLGISVLIISSRKRTQHNVVYNKYVNGKHQFVLEFGKEKHFLSLE